jgi:hypothetical protein
MRTKCSYREHFEVEKPVSGDGNRQAKKGKGWEWAAGQPEIGNSSCLQTKDIQIGCFGI